ncbi:MAG: hypothetical protein DRO09_02725 [Thermoprotei archaeon]|nr:MAG: hypothetical protein DRO09_02725 [Thermoprotei archaeon]
MRVISDAKVIITGRPGVGKTTVFTKVVSALKDGGLRVYGFMCPEVRRGGTRIGFDIIDIATGRRGVLSRLCSIASSKVRVGRYCVNEYDAVRIGVQALLKGLSYADVIAIDEVGPMELKVDRLRSAIYTVLRSSKPVLAVVHRSIVSRLSKEISAATFWVNEVNRNSISSSILKRLIEHP